MPMKERNIMTVHVHVGYFGSWPGFHDVLGRACESVHEVCTLQHNEGLEVGLLTRLAKPHALSCSCPRIGTVPEISDQEHLLRLFG